MILAFRGLKQPVNAVHHAEQTGRPVEVPVLAATVRRRVCDMLLHSTLTIAERCGYQKIAVAGGVSANSELRSRLKQECAKRGYTLYLPDLAYCGDNAAMVGAQAAYEPERTNFLGLNAVATMPLDADF